MANWYDKQFPKLAQDDRPGCWLRWLAETDEEEALLYRHKEAMKQKAKTMRATMLLHFQHEKGTVDEKKAMVETNDEVYYSDKEYFDAEQSWRTLHNQRDTVNTAYEAWRTMRADQRATAKGM